MTPSKDPAVEKRKTEIKDTHLCPYCERKLDYCDVSGNAMGAWGAPELYVCFNDECPYHAKSSENLAAQGIIGGAYRLAWDPERDWCGPIASRNARFTKG